MAGGRQLGSKDDNPSTVLLSETERVLDNQIRVIQKQQDQATKVLRVLLAAFGLILTLLSISFSADIVNFSILQGIYIDMTSEVSFPSDDLTIVFIFLVVTVGIYFAWVLARLLLSALLVLSPRAERELIFKILYPFEKNNDTSGKLTTSTSDEKLNKDLSEITPRSGIDAQKASDIMMEDPSEYQTSILEYHIGCIHGNEVIIKSNRQNLRDVYKYTAFFGFLLAIVLFYLAGFVVIYFI
jgi:hypothetical protein